MPFEPIQFTIVRIGYKIVDSYQTDEHMLLASNKTCDKCKYCECVKLPFLVEIEQFELL